MDILTQPSKPDQSTRGRLTPRDLAGSGWPIVIATLVLFAVSPLIVSGSVGSGSLLSMLPFASILAVASIGQTLVVQQRGFDLSVPGMVSLSAVIVTKYADGQDSRIPMALLVVAAVALAVGAVNGIAVTWFGISPIVATLAMNSLLIGMLLKISGGATTRAPEGLSSFAIDRTFGLPNTLWMAVIICAAAWFVTSRMTVGRRFEALGSNERAARLVGIRVQTYKVGTYAAASLLYAIAGVMLAAFLQSPGLFVGDIYLFATVTAVVIAGTPLTGGKGNVVAVAVAALFLSQLESLVLSVTSGAAWRYIVQAVVIGVGMALHGFFKSSYWASRRQRALVESLESDLDGKDDSREH